ncbi:hypothetical protein GCM10022384_00760 [Streptomyces marokkonensis]|uniref:Uncharacterized protein n=1 Tax=Streptomyces marokkonensis TaxID=324855 RepID=A0ABP7NN76_9ACTN
MVGGRVSGGGEEQGGGGTTRAGGAQARRHRELPLVGDGEGLGTSVCPRFAALRVRADGGITKRAARGYRGRRKTRCGDPIDHYVGLGVDIETATGAPASTAARA